MALTFGFYNSVNGDRKYDAIQMSQIFDGIITDGIYATFLKAMVVKASTNPSEVFVQPGRAWFDHTWTYIDADFPVTAPAPEVILDRIDTLVLDIDQDNAGRENKIIWVKGTPSSVNPDVPTLVNTATHHQYPLCNVYRKAGTTMIYAEDITNRIGTSDTPFVTGVLDHINIDDLLSQWDAEFHTWESTTKTEFEAWMATQENVYTAWWDSLKNQMAGDVADVEAWIQTIHDIIDSETATHLQLEIDELREWVPNGSYITVTTEESELFSRAVTITDTFGNSDSVNFNNAGIAVFKSFPYIGALTIESTDGAKVASGVIEVPYFSRYETNISFWEAEINLDGDSQLSGTVVTVKDSNGTVIRTIVLDSSGHGELIATRPDTYKFIYTVGGTTMEISLAVTEETTYNVELYVSNVWKGWVTAGGLDPTDYSGLSDLLADEAAIRRLMLIHDSVDYFCENMAADYDIEYIINCDLIAKWVSLSDYAYDNMTEVSAIKTIMDASGKYGHGEWGLVPQVPIMTSNTTPYGEAFSSTDASTSSVAWKAFDGSTSTEWHPVASASNNYVGYHFKAPIAIKRIQAVLTFGSGAPSRTFKIQGSNNGQEYTELGTFTESASTTVNVNINTEGAYSYLRLFCEDSIHSSGVWAITVNELQFYTYDFIGLVPVMTGNTEPYGKASSYNVYNSSTQAYLLFDRVYNTGWQSQADTSNSTWVQYEFNNPTCIKKAFLGVNKGDSNYRNLKFKIQASNDGSTFTDLTQELTFSVDTATGYYTSTYEIENNNYYCYYRLVPTQYNYTAHPRVVLHELQFYGRAMKNLVPTLISNNKPSGVASCVNGTTSAYKPFIGSWLDTKMNSVAGQWLQYKFDKPVNVYFMRHLMCGMGSSGATATQVLKTSTDGTNFTNASSAYTRTHNTANYAVMPVTEGVNKTYFRITCTAVSVNSGTYNMTGIYFYGFDYSEKEFESGANKKWLYDHGVDVETLDYNVKVGADGYIINDGTNIILKCASSGSGNFVAILPDIAIDLENYNCVCGYVRDITAGIAVRVFASKPTAAGAGIASASFNVPIGNPKVALDISSVNQSAFPSIYNGSNGSIATIKEMWLE